MKLRNYRVNGVFIRAHDKISAVNSIYGDKSVSFYRQFLNITTYTHRKTGEIIKVEKLPANYVDSGDSYL